MMRRVAMLGLTLAAAGAGAAERRAPNPLIDALAACLQIRDDPQRLACTDAAATRLVAAERARDVVVVTRDEVKRTRRSLFGLSVDNNQVFAGADTAAERVDQLDTTLAVATFTGNDRWTLQLAEGGRWQTSESWINGSPKAGMTVEIRRAALGSYILRARGQRTVRVRRVN